MVHGAAMKLCDHVFIYREYLGGYAIVCRKCGEPRGSSESPDRRFLAAINRNYRRASAVRRASALPQRKRA